MKLTFKLLGVAVAVFSASFSSHGQVIEQKERVFKVTYDDGGIERYAVVFTGYVIPTKREDGGPAGCFGDFPNITCRPIDTRQCHWQIVSKVTRDVYQIHRSGKRIPVSELSSVPYNVDSRNKGSDWVLANFAKENCNQADARYSSDVNNSVQKVKEFMSNVHDSQATSTTSDLRDFLASKSVSPL